MSTSDSVTPRRIHIGNISPKLRENGDMLGTRLSKFGTLIKPLEFHTKPVNDFYFAFAEMELSDKQYDKLKAAFNGILYMGRKITIGLAKADFQQKWAKDSGRPAPPKKALDAKSGISKNRNLRIQEAHAPTPRNSVSGAPLCKTSTVGANNSSLGYSKSAHTFQDMSGNTKNSKPSQSLVGSHSYGSSLVPKGPFFQQYSRTSGYGDVVKGRIRKTPRSAAYFVRKQQTMRILINGELKQIKCYKIKLWGVEKNRTVLDLTYKYVDGSWKSGDDHVVERSVGSKKDAFLQTPASVKCGISGDQAETYGQSESTSVTVAPLNNDEDSGMDMERAKNAAILAKLFNNNDLEKHRDFDVDDMDDEDTVTYDSKGRKSVQRFDFETQGTLAQSDSDDEDGDARMDIVEEFRTSTERPPEEVYYSESDEGNDIDMDALQQQYTTEAIKTQYDEEHDVEYIEPSKEAKDTSKYEAKKGSQDNGERKSSENESDASAESQSEESKQAAESEVSEASEDIESSEEESEEESEDDNTEAKEDKSDLANEESEASSSEEEDLMPKFTAPESTSTTENLRSLFNQSRNQEAQGGFGFAIENDDIDENNELVAEEERQKLLEQIKTKQAQENVYIEKRRAHKKKAGLFWAHLDSPFLQAQTQLSKVGTVGQKITLPGEENADDTGTNVAEQGDEDAYEKWFWSVRGEISRECRKRRREVTKHISKKNVRAYV